MPLNLSPEFRYERECDQAVRSIMVDVLPLHDLRVVADDGAGCCRNVTAAREDSPCGIDLYICEKGWAADILVLESWAAFAADSENDHNRRFQVSLARPRDGYNSAEVLSAWIDEQLPRALEILDQVERDYGL